MDYCDIKVSAGLKNIIRQNGSFRLVGNGATVVIGNSVIVQQFHVHRKYSVRILSPVNHVAALTPPVNAGVFNARCVGNKSASINHWIADSTAVVETRHDSLDCPDLTVTCAPPIYHYIERARPRSATSAISTRINHGGVCLFYHC